MPDKRAKLTAEISSHKRRCSFELSDNPRQELERLKAEQIDKNQKLKVVME